MNTHYSFFNLLVALDSVRKTKKQPPTPQRSSVSALPEIDYSLLRTVLASNRNSRDREFQFVVLEGGLSTRNSGSGQQLTYSAS